MLSIVQADYVLSKHVCPYVADMTAGNKMVMKPGSGILFTIYQVLWWDQVHGNHLLSICHPHANKTIGVPQEVPFFWRAHFAGLTSIWLFTEIREHFSQVPLHALLNF